MNDIQWFADCYGTASDNTSSPQVLERLQNFPAGQKLTEVTGAGVFDSGFFSIASVREDVSDFGNWQRWLPADALWFASSVFGVLYFAAPDGCMWLVNSQVGSVMETAYPLDEAIARVAVPSARNDLLMRPLFQEWMSIDRVLPPDCLLWSDPPAVESGSWSADHLVPMKNKEFIDATAGLFQPYGPIPISIMQPGH